MSPFEVVTLRNGEQALKDRASGEIMHPTVGPWAEAHRLYVEQSKLADKLRRGPVRLFDVGLGGGANALAAVACAETTAAHPLELISFDTTIEGLELAAATFPFARAWEPAIRSLIERGSWEGPRTRWTFRRGDVLAALPDQLANVVFFDPFSPKVNPGLWTVEAFRRFRAVTDGELFTYSAATPVRVALLLAGFFVGAGLSVATKSETTVAAARWEALERPLSERWLQRWRRSPHHDPALEAAVVGHPQFQNVKANAPPLPAVSTRNLS